MHLGDKDYGMHHGDSNYSMHHGDKDCGMHHWDSGYVLHHGNSNYGMHYGDSNYSMHHKDSQAQIKAKFSIFFGSERSTKFSRKVFHFSLETLLIYKWSQIFWIFPPPPPRSSWGGELFLKTPVYLINNKSTLNVEEVHLFCSIEVLQ